MGIWDGQKLNVSKNWRTWKLITTGPIRSEFELTYDAWDAGGGRMVSETKRISIDAGSNLSRVESTFSSDDKSPLANRRRSGRDGRVKIFSRPTVRRKLIHGKPAPIKVWSCKIKPKAGWPTGSRRILRKARRRRHRFAERQRRKLSPTIFRTCPPAHLPRRRTR